jgi:hypothetical protein
LTPSLTKPSAGQVDLARTAAKRILSAYPDYGKAPPEYIINFAEALSYLTETELAAVLDPRTGIVSRCQFLPTIADIHALLRESEQKAAQFAPTDSGYTRFKEDFGPWDDETDYERKRRVVREALGYNPGDKGRAGKRDLVPPTAEDLANLKLKTPPAPASKYLIAQLKADGWPFIPGEDTPNARHAGRGLNTTP